jgi:hypothetical protein
MNVAFLTAHGQRLCSLFPTGIATSGLALVYRFFLLPAAPTLDGISFVKIGEHQNGTHTSHVVQPLRASIPSAIENGSADVHATKAEATRSAP